VFRVILAVSSCNFPKHESAGLCKGDIVYFLFARSLISDGSPGSGMWGYGLDSAGSECGQVAALVNAVMNFRVP
jgi:hypothetical protein